MGCDFYPPNFYSIFGDKNHIPKMKKKTFITQKKCDIKKMGDKW